MHQVFDALEFRVLRDRLYQYLDAVEPEAESGFDLAGEVLATGAVAAWLAEHAPAGVPTGLAVAGTFGRGTGTLTGVAVATADGAGGLVRPGRAGPGRRRRRWPTGWPTRRGRRCCTTASRRCWRSPRTAGSWAGSPATPRWPRTWPGRTSAPTTWPTWPCATCTASCGSTQPETGQLTFDGLGDDGEVEQNLMLRARATLDLADAIDAELARDGELSARLLADVELPLVRVLGAMERVGIAADTDYLSELEAHFAAEVKAAAQAAYEVVGREFNLGSPKQLQEILFTELRAAQDQEDQDRLHHRRRRAAVALRADRHPVLEHLLRHRDVAKLKSTVDGLLKSVSDDGRIHTTFNQTVAATGRLSSTDPNLQNIPIRTEEGRRIRRAFVVGDGLRARC